MVKVNKWKKSWMFENSNKLSNYKNDVSSYSHKIFKFSTLRNFSAFCIIIIWLLLFSVCWVEIIITIKSYECVGYYLVLIIRLVNELISCLIL